MPLLGQPVGPDRSDANRTLFVGEAVVTRIHDTASEVAATDRAVTVDGPGGVAVTLTPEAALEMSERLRDAGLEATVKTQSASGRGGHD